MRPNAFWTNRNNRRSQADRRPRSLDERGRVFLPADRSPYPFTPPAPAPVPLPLCPLPYPLSRPSLPPALRPPLARPASAAPPSAHLRPVRMPGRPRNSPRPASRPRTARKHPKKNRNHPKAALAPAKMPHRLPPRGGRSDNRLPKWQKSAFGIAFVRLEGVPPRAAAKKANKQIKRS